MKNILFLHQSAELYGSDKVLRDIILGIDRDRYKPIVILPYKGILYELLINHNIEVHVSELGIISRSNSNIIGVLSILIKLAKSISSISKIIDKRDVSIVHSNTIVVLSGAVWACFNRNAKHIWHLHEIVHNSPLTNIILGWTVNFLSHKIICDSHAVLASISNNSKSFIEKSTVVWNGYERNQDTDNTSLVKSSNEKIIVLLVGRFNRMKGQMFILECIKHLPAHIQDLFIFRFVGSPPLGQEFYLSNFIESADEFIQKGTVEIYNFTSNIEKHWKSADIAIVPSIEPEAFGLVAIEAMAHCLPVIASNIGGLSEIVVHNETGFLFEPSSIVQFCDCLTMLIDTEFREELGANSFKRYLDNFTLDIYRSKIFNVYSKV